MADSYEINLEIQGGEQPALVMETEGGATDGASARNAEAWAAGTRNGVPVGENDPAYHNNSKYYRDSAAAIAAGDVIDDDAGRGDLMLAWSADKLVGEFGKKAPAIVVSDTTPEAVKTFSDGADGMPMGLTVGIEPVQDLHGYDNPWPGGANTSNLFNESTVEFGKWIASDGSISEPAAGCISQYIPVTGGNAYGITFKGEAPFSMSICEYDANGTFLLRTHYSTGGKGNVTLNASTAKVIVQAYATSFSGTQSAEMLASEKVMFYAGSTEPSAYAPYSNICPISGWTGAEITRAGKNLLNAYGTDTNNGFKDENSLGMYGEYVGSYDGFVTEYFSIPADTVCTLSGISGINTTICFYDDSKTFISAEKYDSRTSFQIQTPAMARYARASVPNAKKDDVQFVIGTDATYEAFAGNHTYSITFPSSAGTVYGGNLTVNADGTGTLVVDKGFIDMQSSIWALQSINSYGIANFGYYHNPVEYDFTDHGISNMLPFQTTTIANTQTEGYSIAGGNTVYIRLKSDKASTVAQFKTWAEENGLQILFKLATPVTYTLTAPQVETLKGNNVLWADTGDIKAVDYPADTQLYIDGKIAELQALILENISNS